MRALARKITEHESFDDLIVTLLLFNAAAMGAETSQALVEVYGDGLFGLFVVSQVIFVLEILLRLVAAADLRSFFKDPWNSFDTAIVALSLIPAVGSLALLARLLRILRLARLFSVAPAMRSWMGRLADSTGLLARVGAGLLALFYVFGVAGHACFADADPDRWGSLGAAVLTLAELSFGEQLRATVVAATEGAGLGALYFIAWYALLGALLVTAIGEVVARRSEP